MKITYKQYVIATFMAAACMSPAISLADSGTVNGGGPLSVPVDLDFRVVIPGTLRFRVGTDGAGSVDEVLFEPPVDDLGVDFLDVAATNNGTVSVSLFCNIGPVTITPTNNGGGNGLNNGIPGEYIPYSEILTSENNPALANPPLTNTGGAADATTPTPTSGNGKVTNYPGESWFFTYDNTAVYPVGTYTGTVTYTASAP